MTDDINELKAEITRLRKTISEHLPPLETMLQHRGFRIFRKEPVEEIIEADARYRESFYEHLKKYSFRLFLRDVIKHQDLFDLDKVTRYATKEVSKDYIDFLLKTAIAVEHDGGFRLKKRPVKSFGETLEWFIARLIREEFSAETVWGVKFRRPHVGGDYDVLAKIESFIVYLEVKSSPPKQIYDRMISAFFDRVDDLAPEMSIFLVDTELRMKDKIVPMFEKELRDRYDEKIVPERIQKELFHIGNRIFIINSKGGISANIGTALSYMLRKRTELAH